MRNLTRNNTRGLRRITATGLVPLLFLAALPGCVARHMPDWEKVQDVDPETKTEVQLYKESSLPGERKIKGRFVSATGESVTLKPQDRQIETFQRKKVRKVLAHRELGKRWPGWVALGISLALCSGFWSADFTPAGQVLLGMVTPVGTAAAFFYGSRMGGIYEVPPKHRDWFPPGANSPPAEAKKPEKSK